MLRSLVAFAALANGRLRRLALRRKLKDACWRRSHTHCRRWWWRRDIRWSLAIIIQIQTCPRHTSRTPTWSSDLRGHYFAWNWIIHVVMLATVVATATTLSSNSCKSAIFYAFYFRTTETVHRERQFLMEANSYKRALALRNSKHRGLLTTNDDWLCWSKLSVVLTR